MTNYLTPDEVEHLHDSEMREGVDLPGVNRDKLEAAVMRCQSSAFGQDAFPALHDKAAALFTALINYHPFVDGNKRTAVIALHAFYLLNGHRLIAATDEIVGLALAVAQGYLDIDQPDDQGDLVERLEGWAQPIKYDDDLD